MNDDDTVTPAWERWTPIPWEKAEALVHEAMTEPGTWVANQVIVALIRRARAERYERLFWALRSEPGDEAEDESIFNLLFGGDDAA